GSRSSPMAPKHTTHRGELTPEAPDRGPRPGGRCERDRNLASARGSAEPRGRQDDNRRSRQCRDDACGASERTPAEGGSAITRHRERRHPVVAVRGLVEGDVMTPTTVEQLSRAEFEQLSADERREHVQNTLTALRQCIPKSGAAAGAFIDARLYVQELAGWA